MFFGIANRRGSRQPSFDENGYSSARSNPDPCSPESRRDSISSDFDPNQHMQETLAHHRQSMDQMALEIASPRSFNENALRGEDGGDFDSIAENGDLQPREKLEKQSSKNTVISITSTMSRRNSERLDEEQRDWLDYRRYILEPGNRKLLFWDIFMLMILLFVAFYLPFRVSFLNLTGYSSEIPQDLLNFERAIDIFFWIDLALNFFKGFEDEETGLLNDNFKDIAVRYFKGFFILDFIATFPFDDIVAASSTGGTLQAVKLTRLPRLLRILKVLRLLKLLRIYKLNEMVLKMETNYGLHQGFSQITLIIGIILIVTHVVGCIWHFIAFEDENSDICKCEVDYDCDEEYADQAIDVALYCPWVWRLDYYDKRKRTRYIASIYWALSSLTTVGYGDISGSTKNEQMYCMAVMIIGVSWYAYIVSSMSTIMHHFDDKEKRVREKLAALHAFARDKKIPTDLARRLQNYTEYILHKNPWHQLGTSYENNDTIMRDLPSHIRNEVIMHVARDIIKQCHLLEHKEPTFIADFIERITPKRLEANQYLLKQGNPADEMYFLTKGNVALIVESENGRREKYRHYFEGSHFGALGCVVGGFYEYSVKAETACEVQVMNKRNLLSLMVENPVVFEDLRESGQKMRERLKLFKDGNLEERVRVLEEQADDADKVGLKPQPTKDLRHLGKGGMLGAVNTASDHLGVEKIPLSHMNKGIVRPPPGNIKSPTEGSNNKPDTPPATYPHLPESSKRQGRRESRAESLWQSRQPAFLLPNRKGKEERFPPMKEEIKEDLGPVPVAKPAGTVTGPVAVAKPAVTVAALKKDSNKDAGLEKTPHHPTFTPTKPLRQPSITDILLGSENPADWNAPHDDVEQEGQHHFTGKELDKYIEQHVDKVMVEVMPRIEQIVADCIDKIAKAAANVP